MGSLSRYLSCILSWDYAIREMGPNLYLFREVRFGWEWEESGVSLLFWS